MPVRIHEISKQTGVPSKEVIAKARELGITTAKTASSTIDKITAAYLIQQLGGVKQPSPPPATEPAPVEPPVQEQPQPTAEQAAETAVLELPPTAPPAQQVAEPPRIEIEQPSAEPQVVVTEKVQLPAETEVSPPQEQAPSAAPAAKVLEAEVRPAETQQPAQAEEPKPAEPPKPRIGEKVGFIQLPPRPRPAQKPGPPSQPALRAKAPPAPAPPRARPEQREVKPGPLPSKPVIPQPRQTTPSTAPTQQPVLAALRIAPPPSAPTLTIKPPITVRTLAEKLNKKPFQIIADLMELKLMANVNQVVDETVAKYICAKYGFKLEVEKRAKGVGLPAALVKKPELDEEDRPEALRPRPPVVTVMGHVDHGKTTLLDVIRKTNVAANEAGGITQHIGAYTISIPHPERKNELAQITFLDTPGHEAFSSMRARGANVTDIVVLVVAANEGVMPQTIEALDHARAAKVPIIVAVNKCDHPTANPLKVRQQLQERGLVPDEWGGDTIFVDVSALTGRGVDRLLEMILFQAEMLELKANPNRRAKGYVIESGIEPGGPAVTLLVKTGTLRVGDTIICGQYYGRVRALIDAEGKRLKEAGPSVAAKMLGLNGVPDAGLEFNVVENEKAARELAEKRAMEARAASQAPRPKITLENLFATLEAANEKTFKLVVKADTQGSVEAIVDALNKIESDKVKLEILHSAVGPVSENDVALAAASNAVVLGFHTRIDPSAAERAKREGVQIKLYTIIYELIDQVKEAMTGLLEPVEKEVVLGTAEVRKVFPLSKGVPVAGCVVLSGRMVRGRVRVLRRKELVFEGVIQSMRRFQDEVTEVRAGMECGIRIEGFGDYQEGDVLECYTIEKVAQKL
ncbi:MAG: translation initiation factor IF-2 [Verrucomicrobiae bacterium]|nr:translation initiation factor IF-2 [Verrucomicrobiae bacterium]